VKEQCVAKRKTTASGRDPEVSDALFEVPGDDVAEAAVEDSALDVTAVDDAAPDDAAADPEIDPSSDDDASESPVTTEADDLTEDSSTNHDATIDDESTDAAGTVDDEPSLDEDPSGQDLARDLPDPGPYEVAPDEDEAEELAPEVVDEDPEQLDEAEEVAASATSTTPVRRPRSAKAPVKKKDAPTKTRKEATAVATDKRTGPVTFVQQSIAELRKVVWPTGAQLSQYFVVVLIFVLVMIAIVGLLDLGFGAALLKLLG
jgi:preprotein translocase subunit SecE